MNLTPTCATGTHAPQTDTHGTPTCCATPASIASIDFQLGMILACVKGATPGQLEPMRATYRASVARRKELVAAAPHAAIRTYRKPSTGNAGYVDCACGETFTHSTLNGAGAIHLAHQAKHAR